MESVPPNAPSYEEAMKYPPPSEMMHPYPNLQQQYQPQNVQPGQQVQPIILTQPPVLQPTIQTFNIGGGGQSATCRSCLMPLHTRVGHFSTCTTHCGFLFCCLFLCWPCAPFVYCTDMCREPRLLCVNCGSKV